MFTGRGISRENCSKVRSPVAGRKARSLRAGLGDDADLVEASARPHGIGSSRRGTRAVGSPRERRLPEILERYAPEDLAHGPVTRSSPLPTTSVRSPA
ncbi:hypothetical protein ACIRPH_29130 [Nocardiopsis sp. NPDC101807]|uniref:hypothetical protein n=1 Tax=Nocardiopsis sp. NPDC101807 TaxID=3364339 RepID=UPI003802088A